MHWKGLILSFLLLGFLWLGFRVTFHYFSELINHQPPPAMAAAPEDRLITQNPSPDTFTENTVLDSSLPGATSSSQPPMPLFTKPRASPVRLATQRLLLHTVGGDILLCLYPEVAPETVSQLIALVKSGCFDTTHFSRLEPGFVLQTSVAQDRLIPLSEEQRKLIRPIKGEFSKQLKHRKGVLSMGRADGRPDSAESSFSILLGNAPHLDGQYTIFGHVEAGMEVVERLAQMPRQPDSNKPETRLTILRAEVIFPDDLATLAFEKPRARELIENQPYSPIALSVHAAAILRQHCWRCHGGQSKRGGLDLTSEVTFQKGGEHGPVLNRDDLQKSALLERINAHDERRMPPEGSALHPEEIKVLAQWLGAGATFPPQYALRKNKQAEPAINPTDKLWSLQPLQKAVPPVVQQHQWVKNDLDRFILAALEKKKVTPNPSAASGSLRRRLSFGLTGLPPDYGQGEDRESYTQTVDRLLESKHFGEHMARHWLDLVRYADSDGYENDKNRPLAFTYRDFIIRAFNDDMPFDQFLRWQIAGDELAPESAEALAATGFNTAGPYQTFFPKKKDRCDELDDIVSTAGVAFMGLTVGCARCHNHKHDPISQHDYYRLVSVWNGGTRRVDYLDTKAGAEYQVLRAPIDRIQIELDSLSAVPKEKVRRRKIDQLPITQNEKEILYLPVDPNNGTQVSLLHRFEHLIQVTMDEARGECDADLEMQWDELASQITVMERQLPPQPQKGLIFKGSQVQPARFLERGDAELEKELVPPGFLTCLTRGQPIWRNETWQAWGATPRAALAHWLTDVDAGAGRLVARVIVNRIWQIHFGAGLVRTANDFGMHGEKPSHPELLDWLAGELIKSGWKLKHLHRLIVRSATYQVGAQQNEPLTKADPENRLFGRRTVQRLSAESLRDAILLSSGSMNRQMHGPGIRPPIPKEAIFDTAPKHGVVWPMDAQENPDSWRRSIYVVIKRSNPVPFFQLFDAPDASASCAKRHRSTVPTQAMALLNDPFIRTQALLLAERLHSQAKNTPQQEIDLAFRRILGRAAAPQELAQSKGYLERQRKQPCDNPEVQALADLCQILFMSNAFLYVD